MRPLRQTRAVAGALARQTSKSSLHELLSSLQPLGVGGADKREGQGVHVSSRRQAGRQGNLLPGACCALARGQEHPSMEREAVQAPLITPPSPICGATSEAPQKCASEPLLTRSEATHGYLPLGALVPPTMAL